MFVNRLFRSISNPAVPLSSKTILSYFEGNTSASGKKVSVKSSLTYSPIWAGVDLISGDCSRMPFEAWEMKGEDEFKATAHPTHRLLVQNTGEMTSNLWVGLMLVQALLYGNSYSRIFRDGNRDPAKLQWLHADLVTPAKREGQKVYIVRMSDGREDVIEPEGMFHLRGLAVDDLGGLSIVEFARNTIGRMLSAEGYGDDFFAHGAVPEGWFMFPDEMSDPAKNKFIAAVEKRHKGDGKRHRLGILENDMKWVPSGITPEDALLVDLLKFGVKDVARFLRLPPHKLGDDSRVAYNSIAQENRAYFESSLGTWTSRLQHEANDKLFTTDEKKSFAFFTRFDSSEFLKPDFKERMEGIKQAIEWGVMSFNEGRRRLGLNPRKGGDEFLTPLNMSTTGGTAPPRAVRSSIAHRDLVSSALKVAARRLIKSSQHASKKPSEFIGWLNSIEMKHGQAVSEILRPSCNAAAAHTGAEVDVDPLVQNLFNDFRSIMLIASECSADELSHVVTHAGNDVLLACDKIADSTAILEVA